MRHYLAAVSAFCFLGVGVASASSTIISADPAYGSAPFSFYCSPYHYSFEAGKHYLPDVHASCTFSIPNDITGYAKSIALYRGVPGTSVLIATEQVSNATLAQVDTVNFGSPAAEQDYFAAVYDTEQADAFANAFTIGSSTGTLPPPNSDAHLLRWRWGAKPSSEFEPVIVIPGILGSWQKNGQWVLDPILHTYDNLVNTFLANGYVADKTIFTFGYDWEKSNIDTAHLISQKIESVKQTCKCSHVDLVAHSMGGLVAAQYIESADYKDDVDQAFFIATPFEGAPAIYRAWEGGVIELGSSTSPSTLIAIQNKILNRIYDREAKDAGYENIFEYIQGKPVSSVQELLPIYDYLFSATNLSELIYPNDYPRNSFLEGLVKNFSRKVRDRVQTNVILADDHMDDTQSGFAIAPSSRLPLWPDGEPSEILTDAGDGTVPRSSIENLIGVAEKEFNADHNGIASSSGPYIFREMNGRNVSSISGKTYSYANVDFSILTSKIAPSAREYKAAAETTKDIVISSTIRSALFIILFSPIDMQVTAPDGKRIGKDFITNSTINEIPDAVYSGPIDEYEYLLIPNPLPGTYQVKTIGTGSGVYTVATSYLDQATSSISLATGTTTTGEIISNTLVLSSTSTSLTIARDIIAPTLTPDTCVADMTKAYQNKSISKRGIYDGLVFDCKALKNLFASRDMIEKVPEGKRTRSQNNLLTATLYGIKLTLDHMDLLAKDKSNTKDAVELVHTYTTWFRSHELQ
jgi:pimeloyl-ACP methyl ester carboxylesterase